MHVPEQKQAPETIIIIIIPYIITITIILIPLTLSSAQYPACGHTLSPPGQVIPVEGQVTHASTGPTEPSTTHCSV